MGVSKQAQKGKTTRSSARALARRRRAGTRHRIQSVIDQRFYRHKYDAQRVFAEFARTARDETDLNKLTDELIRVVDETMQPKRLSLWLNKIERRVKQ